MLYKPYGECTVLDAGEGDDNFRYKFNTHEEDKTGLTYFNARYYDSETGRFITPDPTIPNPFSSQSYNRDMSPEPNIVRFRDK